MPRAAIMIGPGQPVEVQDRPSADLEPGSILLETIYSEVCGTDVHLHHGRLAGVPYPIIPGHVSVGRVIEVASESVDIDGQPIREGAIVTFHDVHETCHACWYCQVARAPNRCPSRKVYGVTYGADDGLLGGWSESIYLKPGVKVIPLPETVSPERLIAAGCGLATAIHAIDRAEIRVGDAVAIQGSGPVGLGAAILARLSGADPVVVVGDPTERLEAAHVFGVDDTLSVSETVPAERIEWVRELTGGRGADVTIEATGVPSAVGEGLGMTRDAGRYVIVGHYTDAGEVSINPHTDINLKHLEIRGTWGADFNHFYRMVRILARHGDRFDWERMITRRYR
ncbi:MAG: zinc-binding dehydrogenase, partial [Gemmatimonadetes bacterium]|nr:zinc-binding dehydrogenase [Gemmatimonadota bacterium]